MMLIPLLGRGQTPKNLYFEGNSFFDHNNAFNIPDKIMGILNGVGLVYNSVNNAVSNATIAQAPGGGTNYMLYPPRLNTMLNGKSPNSLKDIVVVFELINDLYYQIVQGGATSSDNTYNNLITYMNKVNGNGQSFIFNTCTPSSLSGIPNSYEPLRQQLNDRLRWEFNIPTGTARIFRSRKYPNSIMCDIGADPFMGFQGASNNTGYYQPDGVHPNASTGAPYLANSYHVPAILMT